MPAADSSSDDVILVQFCQLVTRKRIFFPHHHYTPELAALLYRQHVDRCASEMYMALVLDRQRKMRRLVYIALGNSNWTAAQLDEAIQSPVLAKSKWYVLLHNHIDNILVPSARDIQLTRQVCAIAGQMHITLVDHLIVGNDFGWISMREKGFL